MIPILIYIPTALVPLFIIYMMNGLFATVVFFCIATNYLEKISSNDYMNYKESQK